MKAIVKTKARGFDDYVEFDSYEEALAYHKKFLEYDNVESILIKTEVILNEVNYDDY